MTFRALALYAGPAALCHVQRHGLLPQHVGVVPAAAGGPKGLTLLRLDQFLFGHWLPQGRHPVHLVGASIGAWRMAAACLNDPVHALEQLEYGYIHVDAHSQSGERTMPTPSEASAAFVRYLQQTFADRVPQALLHPRWRLHVLVSQGRHILQREQGWRTALGYSGAYIANAVHRQALSFWLQRLVFSAPGADGLPFDSSDFRTVSCRLTEDNFFPVLQASGSIPFLLRAVHDIPGAPAGACWDGGITDYHLHLRYRTSAGADEQGAIVLYPHFQQAVVPGWLDKAWRWRHCSTSALDHVLLLAPRPEWVRQLPGGKLPDRTDFQRYRHDSAQRIRIWNAAVQASQQLADEFAAWLERPDPACIQPL